MPINSRKKNLLNLAKDYLMPKEPTNRELKLAVECLMAVIEEDESVVELAPTRPFGEIAPH